MTLVLGPAGVPPPAGVEVIAVGTAEEMREAVARGRGTPTSW